MNADIDHRQIVTSAIERLNVRLGHAVILAIDNSVKDAVTRTPYCLDAQQVVDDISSFDTGHWADSEYGPQMVGVCRIENVLWVGGHEYLIPILTGLVFMLKAASAKKEEREQATSVFSLVGHAIRRQAK